MENLGELHDEANKTSSISQPAFNNKPQAINGSFASSLSCLWDSKYRAEGLRYYLHQEYLPQSHHMVFLHAQLFASTGHHCRRRESAEWRGTRAWLQTSCPGLGGGCFPTGIQHKKNLRRRKKNPKRVALWDTSKLFCSIPRNAQGQAGQGPEQSHIVGGIHTHGRRGRTR